jgi:hypothetical protein
MSTEEKNKLAPREESTEVTLSPEDEAKALLEETKGNAPPILKYKEEIGYHIRNEPVPLGTRFFAYPGSWERQAVRFDDNKVTQRIRVKVSSRKLLPERKTLSDPYLQDTDHDPWSYQNVIAFEDANDGSIIQFTTQTTGGKMAIEEMVKTYSKTILAGKARGLPIIELQIGSFRTSYGKDQPRPAFPIIDWENPEPPAASTEPTIIPPEPKKEAKAVTFDDDDEEFGPADKKALSDLDDEIPF